MQLGSILGADSTSLTTITTQVTKVAHKTADQACGKDSSLCHAVWNVTKDPTVSHALGYISVPLTILLILIVAVLSHKVISRTINRTVSGLVGETAQRRLGRLRRQSNASLLSNNKESAERRRQRAETIGALLRSASAVVIFAIAALAVLKALSLPIGSFVAGASVATAVLGFGAQNIVRDFLAGFFIVVEDQYGVGDLVDVGETSGVVEFVSLRITRLRSPDGTLWHVPNGEIKKVGNKSQQWSRALVEFHLATGSDMDKALQTAQAEANKAWKEPEYEELILEAPQLEQLELPADPRRLVIRLTVKTKPLEQWQISRMLRRRITDALATAGIEIDTPPEAAAAPQH